jgi:hypothetical protein
MEDIVHDNIFGDHVTFDSTIKTTMVSPQNAKNYCDDILDEPLLITEDKFYAILNDALSKISELENQKY